MNVNYFFSKRLNQNAAKRISGRCPMQFMSFDFYLTSEFRVESDVKIINTKESVHQKGAKVVTLTFFLSKKLTFGQK